MNQLLTFSHPILMFSLFALYGYAAYLGFRSRRTAAAQAQPKHRGKFALSHYRVASVWLVLMVFGMILGLSATYIIHGKLFFSPHFWVGLGMILLISIGAGLAPFMQQRDSQWARRTHVVINILVFLLFAFEVLSGVFAFEVLSGVSDVQLKNQRLIRNQTLKQELPLLPIEPARGMATIRVNNEPFALKLSW